jgi:uncharacterized membrane protein YdbT with pleckstrin-like domain
MVEDPRRAIAQERDVKAFLKTIHLFKDLDDHDIHRIFRRMTYDTLRKGVLLFEEGDQASHFFIVYRGAVRITRYAEAGEEFVASMAAGDFFGETGLMTDGIRSASARIDSRAVLLMMTAEEFDWLLREFPKIGSELETVVKGYMRFQRQRRVFNWMDHEESIHLVEGKHPLVLALSMIPPVGALILSFVSVYFLQTFGLPWVLYTCWLGAALSVVWGVLRFIDWGNDFYAITDRRVVWQEKIVLVYDSRQEAPLETLLSINLDTTLIQRIFGYGDVIVRTYTGSIRMRDMEHPIHFRDALEEYWYRARQVSDQSKAEEVELSIRKRLGVYEEPKRKKKKIIYSEDEIESAPPRKKRETANYFKVRYVADGIVTYRKHWFLLVRRVSAVLALLVILLFLMGARVGGFFEVLTVQTWGYSIVALILLSSPFWIYQYLDWRNDKYQLSDREVIDLEKRPLGREVRKSAPLENILSMEHQRVGIFGLIFNFGTVIINVGDSEFEFVGVHDPADIQREIFDKSYSRRRDIEIADSARKREIVLESLDVYDRIVKEYLAEEPEEEVESQD